LILSGEAGCPSFTIVTNWFFQVKLVVLIVEALVIVSQTVPNWRLYKPNRWQVLDGETTWLLAVPIT